MTEKFRILLVGCGKMGAALLQGWLSRGMIETAVVVEPHPPGNLPPSNLYRFTAIAPGDFIPDIVVFAVKPQILDDIARTYSYLAGKSLFLSIAAGKTLSKIENTLGTSAAIVRTMPNLPASIGHGITAAVANKNVSTKERQIAENLMTAVGDVVWLTDETQMDAVTAVSGSGPAYLFLLVEELEKAAVAAGLPAELAAKLARRTVTGSGYLLEHSDLPPSKLRENVTSPGGTTAAALDILMGDFGTLLEKAVLAATKRSKDLSN